MLVQVFAVCHDSFEEATRLVLDDWLEVLDRFARIEESGKVLAIGTEAAAVTAENQDIIEPN